MIIASLGSRRSGGLDEPRGEMVLVSSFPVGPYAQESERYCAALGRGNNLSLSQKKEKLNPSVLRRHLPQVSSQEGFPGKLLLVANNVDLI